MIPLKSQVSTSVGAFIAIVNNRFTREGARVRMIRADNAHENLQKEIHEFFDTNGISNTTFAYL